MACEIGQTIDFEIFVSERDDARFAAFRKHYAGCPECSREVSRWSQLQAALREPATPNSEHPDEALLVSFASEPEALEAAARAEVAAHLEGCKSCRSELRLLGEFDLASSVRHAMATPSTAPSRAEGSLRETLATALESLTGWLREPALAAVAATLAVAVVGWLWLRAPAERVDPASGLQHAQAPPVAPVEVVREIQVPDTPTEALEAPEALAQRDPVGLPEQTPAESRTQVDQPELQVAANPEPVAEAEPTSEPLPEAILIAAQLPALPISYVAPGSPLLGEGPVRSFGVSRARGASPSLELRVMAPEHVGWVAEATPTLFWTLSEATDLPVEVTLLHDAQIEPLLEAQREGPHAAGLHSISLVEHGVRLEAGVVYRWQVALVVDPERRSKDVRSAGAVLWKASAAAPHASPERAHRLAGSGYWYDAFAQLSAWLATEPDAGNLQAARDALLTQVGLEPAASGRGN